MHKLKEREFNLLIIALILYNYYELYKQLQYINCIAENSGQINYDEFIEDENIRKYIKECIEDYMDRYMKNRNIEEYMDYLKGNKYIEPYNTIILPNNCIKGYIEESSINEHIEESDDKVEVSKNIINDKFLGCEINMLTLNASVSGEVVYGFNDFMALKSLEGTIFINKNSMDIFF